MLRPGKMTEIGKEVVKYKLDVVALQEIRWQGQGQIDKQEYSLFYSGPKRRTGLYGTGFIVPRRTRKSILEFEAVNERICKLRIRGKFRNISITSAHAPTEEREAEKEEFYDPLEQTCWKIQKYDMLVVMGDFNAKIGKENSLGLVVGKYSLHETSSENGVRLGQFTMRNNLVIKSTCFPHKKIHLTTWKSPDAGTNIFNLFLYT
jgi:endonuclease/exonuclease/phosphatase family metal-dependent hydrolase